MKIKKLSGTTLLFLLFILLAAISCEEFIGFDYSADAIDNFTRITGNIKNIFTGEPVFEALVTVGDRKSTSDLMGNYLVYHNYGVDQERDLPVNFSINAKDYYSFSSELLLAPYINEYDIELVYAAPLVLKGYMGWHYTSGNTRVFLVQAEIKDYQGIETLDSVRVSFTIEDDSTRLTIYRKMNLVKQLDENTAYYQRYVDPSIFSPFRLVETFTIDIWDNENYYVSYTNGPDLQPLLFDPDLP